MRASWTRSARCYNAEHSVAAQHMVLQLIRALVRPGAADLIQQLITVVCARARLAALAGNGTSEQRCRTMRQHGTLCCNTSPCCNRTHHNSARCCNIEEHVAALCEWVSAYPLTAARSRMVPQGRQRACGGGGLGRVALRRRPQQLKGRFAEMPRALLRTRLPFFHVPGRPFVAPMRSLPPRVAGE
jgi:hypothetical protein